MSSTILVSISLVVFLNPIKSFEKFNSTNVVILAILLKWIDYSLKILISALGFPRMEINLLPLGVHMVMNLLFAQPTSWDCILAVIFDSISSELNLILLLSESVCSPTRSLAFPKPSASLAQLFVPNLKTLTITFLRK